MIAPITDLDRCRMLSQSGLSPLSCLTLLEKLQKNAEQQPCNAHGPFSAPIGVVEGCVLAAAEVGQQLLIAWAAVKEL